MSQLDKSDDTSAVLDAALKQMSADAYLVSTFGIPVTAIDQALQAGNNNLFPDVLVNGRLAPNELLANIPDANAKKPVLPGATRFPIVLTERFLSADGYSVSLQLPNDPSGFSATVLQSNSDPGEFTVAFRSSEFMEQRNGGDHSRDIDGADTEILLDGLAWAQISSAETWLQQMFAPGGALADAQTVHFTGYSLGGHIATVMTELHPEWVSSTWVFNGSGRGAIASGYSIRQLVDAYNALLADPDAHVPGIQNVRPTDPIAIAEYEAAKREAANPPMAVHSTYLSARHQWALRVIGPYADGIATSTVFSGQSLDPVADAKITYIYGMATHHDDTLVSLSGVLPSNRIRVFIEDQPLYYGPFFVPFTSETDKLSRDFMATHSITLLADSLALLRLFQTVDGELSQNETETIFAAASNRTASASLDAASATYESDSLERALDKLRWNLLPGSARDERRDTPFDPNAAGFSNIDFRNVFHTRIDEVAQHIGASGSTTYSIRPLATMSWTGETGISGLISQRTVAYVVGKADSPVEIQIRAQEDSARGEAYRVAVEFLSPFVLTASTSIYDAEKYSLERFSEPYLKDRSTFLSKVLDRNLNNREKGLIRSTIPGLMQDVDSATTVDIGLPYQDQRGTTPAYFVRFGADANSEVEVLEGGASDDRLYGRGGNDVLRGGGLNDRLEGGDGNDELWGGSGRDMLLGGTGSDELHGDAGLDKLDGGEGDDRLFGGDQDDELRGGPGSDVLDGGSGFDQYIVGRDVDTIAADADGGFLRLEDGRVLAGTFARRGDRYAWTEDASITATIAGTTLSIALGSSGSVLIEGYTAGHFGIALAEQGEVGGLAESYSGDRRPVNVVDGVIRDQWQNPVLGPDAEPSRADEFFGSPFNDEILTFDGNDRVADIWGGNDLIDLGSGDDAAEGGAGADVVYGDAGRDLMYGEEGDDRLYGAYRMELAAALDDGERSGLGIGDSDWLDGGEGRDWLMGDGGDDLLFGGMGDDVIVAGTGDDLIAGDADLRSSVVPTGQPAGASWDWLWNLSTHSPFEFQIESATGSQHDDAISVYASDAGHDVIHAGAGDDAVFGDGGNDTIHGGSGNDVLAGNDGDDVLRGDEGDDRITGDSGAAVVGSGYVVVPGDDVLEGGAGNDWLQGEGGSDYLDAGPGDDILIGDGAHVVAELEGDDVLLGGDGADLLLGGGGQDRLEGGAGDDQFDGGAGDDYLLGGDGNDTLAGGSGDDVLVAGKGRDTLRGGEGNDVYLIDDDDTVVDDSGVNVIRFVNAATRDGVAATLQTRNGVVVATLSSGGVPLVNVPTRALAAPVISASPSAEPGPPTNPSSGSAPLGGGAGDGSGGVSIRLRFANDVPAPSEGGPVAVPAEPVTASLSAMVFEFADGEQWTASDLFGEMLVDPVRFQGSSEDDLLEGFAGDDTLRGLAGHDVILGHGGNDSLEGGSGADTLDGGSGNDRIIGGGGGDTYLFGLGSGQDIVLPDWGDVVRVGTGLLVEDMELSRHVNGDLTIGIAGAPDLMRLSAVFEAGESRIREILFDDGRRLTAPDLLGLTMAPIDGTSGSDTLTGTNLDETLRGFDGQDRLEGKAGNDLLLGGPGTDTYVVGFGSGRDEIREVDGGGGILRLSDGLPYDALVPRLEGSDLLLRLAGTRDGYEQSIRIRDYALHTAAWTIEDDSGASVAMSGFVEGHDRDSDEALQLEFRWGLVHALDRLALAEGLERQPDGRYVSTPYSGSTVETRVVSRRDLYDISGDGVGGSSAESQSWEGYEPDSLSRFWRELDFAGTAVTAEVATLGAHPESTAQWNDFADVLRHPGEAQEAAVLGADWQFLADPETASAGEALFEVRYDVLYQRDVLLAEVDGTTIPRLNSLITTRVEVVAAGAEDNDLRLSSRAIVDAGAGDDVVGPSAERSSFVEGGDAPEGFFVNGGEGNDRLSGTGYDDTLLGGPGDDALAGSSGRDILVGGPGNDRLDGGASADRYLLRNADAGHDVIADISAELRGGEATPAALLQIWLDQHHPGESVERRMYARDDALLAEAGLVAQDVLEFPEAIQPSHVRWDVGLASAASLGMTDEEAYAIDGGERPFDPDAPVWEVLRATWGDGRTFEILAGDWTVPVDLYDPAQNFVFDWFLVGGHGAGLERFRFEDGSDLGVSAIRRAVYDAMPGIDVSVESQPQAIERGQAEVIRFGADLDPWDLDVVARDRDLQVELRDGRALLTVKDWFDAAQPSLVPSFVFENTARWNTAEVSRRALDRAVTTGDDRLFGAFDLENVLTALEGDDVVVGGSLADTLDGGPGIDWIDGRGGADLLVDQGGGVMRGGAGDDHLTAERGFFLLSGGEGADAISLNDASAVILPGAGVNDVSGNAKHVLLRLEGAGGEQRIDLEPETLTLSLDGALARMAIGIAVSGGDVQVSAGATVVTLSAGTLATAVELRLQTIGDRVRVYDLGAAIDRAGALNTLFPGGEAFDFSANRDDYLIAEWTDRAYGGELAVADVGREADDGGAETSILSLVRARIDEDAPSLLTSSLAPVFMPPTTGDDLIVVPAGLETLRAGAGDDTIYGPAHSLIADGEAGNDYMAGQDKEDYFSGGEGDDVLSGGGGHDALRGGLGHNLILGGAGNDWIFGSAQNDFIAAGPGEDEISLLHGHYVIALNRGDGHDRVAFLGTATAVLSLGDGIRYDDVQLRRNGEDLELGLGDSDGVTLQDWYSDFERTRLMALQFFEGGDDDGDEQAVRLVDFLAGVDAYDRWAATHGTSAWASMHSLMDAGAHDVDQNAYGGGIAQAYARGSDVLMSASVNRVREVLAAAEFAAAPQSLGGVESLRGPGLTLGG